MNYNSNLNYKTEIVNLIENLNANDKVGIIMIGIEDKNPINTEILDRMSIRYKNVYQIVIFDWLDYVDH